MLGLVIGKADVEWDLLIAMRDRYLRDAGLAVDGPLERVAEALANTFRGTSYFKDKPSASFAEEPREINSPIEGLLFKSWCVGCAEAYAALVDSCGMPVRTIGCGGHRVAEVLIDGKWHMVDNSGRNDAQRDRRMYFAADYVQTTQDNEGDHGFFGRVNGQYHFPDGMWHSPKNLRYSAACAYAVYPESDHWVVAAEDRVRLPVINRSGGFWWPSVHGPTELRTTQERCGKLFAGQIKKEDIDQEYLYLPLKKGQTLRQSVFLDGLEDVRSIELLLAFGASAETDISPATGRALRLRIGPFRKSLAELGAWPPKQAEDKSPNWHVRVVLPPGVFTSGRVNWIELEHQADTVLHVPCVPAVMEPYIDPIGGNW